MRKEARKEVEGGLRKANEGIRPVKNFINKDLYNLWNGSLAIIKALNESYQFD